VLPKVTITDIRFAQEQIDTEFEQSGPLFRLAEAGKLDHIQSIAPQFT